MLGLILAFTHLLNQLFAGPVNALLTLVHITPEDAAAPISMNVALQLVVVSLLIAFFIAVRLTLNVERPRPVQHLAEMLYDFTSSQAKSIIGAHGYERYMPFVTSILLFVGVSNLLGLFPGVETPTSVVTVPLGIALLTFVYYNYHGLREQGPIGYLKHFLGPVWWISWLLFPVEIISHLARIMSLTVRLYANMYASDLLTLVFFSMIPFGIPIVFLGLHLGVALIQAYVFFLLALIYIGGAVTHEEAH